MPKKRLIVCCDGTWQSANNGSRSIPSNVAKLSRAIECWDDNIPQLVYYDTGIGTNLASDGKEGWLAKQLESISKKYEGGTGEGLSENVCQAYNFVVNNWTKGDELYVFGFSRGAYTARAFAGLVADVGICTNEMMDQFWEMYTAYKERKAEIKKAEEGYFAKAWNYFTGGGETGETAGPDDNVGERSIWDTPWGKGMKTQGGVENKHGQYWLTTGKGHQWLHKAREINGYIDIQVVGVFDTVGSVGAPETVVSTKTLLDDGFYNTQIDHQVKNAFHALAIDERRLAFTPSIWYLPEQKDPKAKPSTNLIQCWFPGVHINVGGGSDDGLKKVAEQGGDLEGMANVTFAWMVDRVREFTGLKFNEEALLRIAARYMDNLNQVLAREMDRTEGDNKVKLNFRGWGVGPIQDSFSTSDKATQLIGGARTRAPGRYLFPKPKDELAKEASAKKKSSPYKQMITNEYIHPVVAHAWSDTDPADKSYWWNFHYKGKKPADMWFGSALTGFERKPAEGGKKGYKYVQKGTQPSSKGYFGDQFETYQGDVELQEFQIPEDGKNWSMERILITADPCALIQKGSAGTARLNALEHDHQDIYDKIEKVLDDSNARAKQSLASWDKANGFKEDPKTKEGDKAAHAAGVDDTRLKEEAEENERLRKLGCHKCEQFKTDGKAEINSNNSLYLTNGAKRVRVQ